MARVDFSSDRITGNILKTALPLLVAQLFQLLYNIVDRVYIARIPGVGTAALGGVGLCFPIVTLITAFTNLYGAGGMPLFSIELGKGDREEAGRLMGTSFSLLVITAVVLTAAGLLFGEPVLRLFGAGDGTMPYSLPYLRIYLIGTVFSMIATGMNPFINAQGFPTVGMATVLIGAVGNLILDPVFIFVFGLGVRGAAAATVISQALSAAFVLHFLFGKKPGIPLVPAFPGELLRNLRRVFDIVSLGFSSFVMMFTNSVVQVSCNSVLARTGGDLYISVMTIISSVRQVLELPIFALGEGATPTISFNYGARQPARVGRAIRFVLVCGFIYTMTAWGLLSWKPSIFISIFTSDKTIFEDTMRAARMYFFAFPFMILQFSGQTTFKALNKKKRAVFFSIFRKVIIVVPLTYLLPLAFGMGTDGVFLAEPVSNVLGGLACFVTMVLTIVPELRRMAKENAARGLP